MRLRLRALSQTVGSFPLHTTIFFNKSKSIIYCLVLLVQKQRQHTHTHLYAANPLFVFACLNLRLVVGARRVPLPMMQLGEAKSKHQQSVQGLKMIATMSECDSTLSPSPQEASHGQQEGPEQRTHNDPRAGDISGAPTLRGRG